MDWRKSSHSGANGGSCVEVAGTARVVLVRDTTDRDGQTLAFTAEAWRAFAEELKLLASVWKSPARTEHPSLAVPRDIRRPPLHRACPGLRSPACSRFQAGRITSPPSSGYMATCAWTSRSVILKTSVAHNTVNR